MHANVETNLVGQFERTDRHAEFPGSLIDLFPLDTGFVFLHRAHHIGCKNAVHQEPRRTPGDERKLADCRNKGTPTADFLVAA